MEQLKDIIVETETLVTYDVYRKFYLFSLFKGKFYKKGPIIFYIISIFGIIMSLFNGFSFGFDTFTITLLCLLVFLLFFMTFMILYIPKKYFKTSKQFFDEPVKYKFTNEYIMIDTKSEMTSGTSQIKYDALHKVYEVEDMLYIFINNAQAYMLQKKNLSLEDLLQIRNIFKAKLGKKYINYCKN